jgi:hypothetical protein
MDHLSRRVRFLELYAILATTAMAAFAISGFAQGGTRFDEIDVERLNVVEPNGQLRAVIANSARMPDPIIDGKSFKTERVPGLVFYNGLGDECGGLIFGAVAGKGKFGAYGGLTFDQYKQSQSIGLVYNDHNGDRRSGLSIWDRPSTPLPEFIKRRAEIDRLPEGDEKKAALAKLAADDAAPSRVFVGRTKEKDALLTLADAKGRPRIRLVVAADGASKIEFLSEDGKVIRSLHDKD